MLRKPDESAGSALGLAGFGTIVGNIRLLRLKESWEEGATIHAAMEADHGDKKSLRGEL